MFRSLKTATLFSGALLVVTLLGVSSRAPVAYADAQRASETKEMAPDPNKKKPGDPCEKADECQNHHTCAKVGNKKVCKAPPRRELPPGAVT